MLQYFIIFGFSLIGEWLAHAIPFPIPGSILGMILLFAALNLKIIDLKTIKQGGTVLTQYLSFFFIPLTVGVLEYLNILSGSALELLTIIFVTLIITYGVSAKLIEKQV